MTGLISQAVVAGGLTGARPLLALFVLSLAARIGGAQVPNDVAWLIHPYALAVLAALSYVEHEATTDPDFEELLHRPLQVLTLICGAASARLMATGEHADVATATQAVVIGGASFAALLVHEVRRRAFDALDDLLTIESWYARLEAGGVIGLMVAVVALPFLAIGLLAILTIAGVVVALMLGRWDESRDRAARMPCARCGHAVRVEASRCPQCKAQLSPAKLL